MTDPGADLLNTSEATETMEGAEPTGLSIGEILDTVKAVNEVIGLDESIPVDVKDASVEVEQPAVMTSSVLQKLLDEIAPISESEPWRKLQIYGPPGSGKTAFACGVGADPEFAKGVLLLDVENGYETLRNHPETAGVLRLPYKAMVQFEMMLQQLGQNPPELEHIHTVVVDTFTALQERDLRATVQEAARMSSSHSAVVPEGKDYQANTEHMKTIGRLLSDLNRNVIITAHTKDTKDDTTGRVTVSPALTAKLAEYLTGAFGLIGYYTRNDNINGTASRSLQVHPTLGVTAKTRIGGLPPVMVDPVITDLITKWGSTK